MGITTRTGATTLVHQGDDAPPLLTVDYLAQVLQEPNRRRLTQVLRTLGRDRTTALLADTLTCAANGGMLTKDGSRRRTPGGVFFQLVKEQATPQERQRLFPRTTPTPPPALTGAALHALVNTLPQGDATVTLTLTGRPAIQAVHTRPTYVAFRMQGQAPGSRVIQFSNSIPMRANA
jgi:PHAX RNA-binding domain